MAFFLPTYSALAGSVVARGGSQLADIGVVVVANADGTSSLAMGRDARGGVQLVTGADRLISRLTRAFLTPLGRNILTPEYGSEALPGLPMSQQIPLQVADVALREAQITAGSALGAAGQVTRVTATAQALPNDPTQIAVTIGITTADGATATAQIDGSVFGG